MKPTDEESIKQRIREYVASKTKEELREEFEAKPEDYNPNFYFKDGIIYWTINDPESIKELTKDIIMRQTILSQFLPIDYCIKLKESGIQMLNHVAYLDKDRPNIIWLSTGFSNEDCGLTCFEIDFENHKSGCIHLNIKSDLVIPTYNLGQLIKLLPPLVNDPYGNQFLLKVATKSVIYFHPHDFSEILFEYWDDNLLIAVTQMLLKLKSINWI